MGVDHLIGKTISAITFHDVEGSERLEIKFRDTKEVLRIFPDDGETLFTEATITYETGYKDVISDSTINEEGIWDKR